MAIPSLSRGPAVRPRALPSGLHSSSTSTTTVLIVAEHAIVRAGLRSVLDGTPGLSVIAETADAEAAAPLVARVRPDVVLLDSPPADAAARRTIVAIRRAAPDMCVLCLASKEATIFGDVQCVPADAGVAELCSTLGAVLGDRCASCLLRPGCPAPRLAVALSRRETQVAVCVAEGMSSKQIAGALGIALRTVNTYRESLARKLGASSPAVVTRYVLEHKLALSR
jgi:DNA-binding NarL/FixJ family response regulator